MRQMITFERSSGREALRRDLARAGLWCIAAPALAVWPFVSLFPLFEMIAGEPSVGLIATRSLLLATGFWPIAAGFLAAAFATHRQGAALFAARRRDGGLALGLYAAAWMTLYLAIFVLV